MQVKFEKPMGGGGNSRGKYLSSNFTTFFNTYFIKFNHSKINKLHHKEHICKF